MLQLEATYASVPKRYTFGPAVEVGIASDLSVELGALYKRVNYGKAGVMSSIRPGPSGIPAAATVGFQTLVTGNALEFAATLKRRYRRSGARPYVAGGLAGRYLQGLKLSEEQIIETVESGIRQRSNARVETSAVTELAKRFYPGVTLAGGLEIDGAFGKIAPEVRYTRWTAFTSAQAGPLRFAGNQVEVLLGVMF